MVKELRSDDAQRIMRTMRVIGLFTLSLLCWIPSATLADTIRVGVAVSLKDAITEIARKYESQSGDRVEFAFGSSGQIMAQIKSGAAIDALISAAAKQVDELDAAGLIEPETRRIVTGNTLLLIVPRESKAPIDSFESLGRAPVKRLAVGEPKTVPAGQYAVQVLEKLKLMDALKDKLIYGTNARQVLDYVERGEVTAGIVYATDAKQAGESVRVAAAAPRGSHEPIVYPAVVARKSRNAAAARRFLEHLGTAEAQKILAAHGFTAPVEDSKTPVPKR
jgi:molybdate transport system substrate-binding protein